MSLDVYLKGESREVEVRCHCCGHVDKEMETEKFFESNITHNLGRMAKEAGIYDHLWRPEEINVTKAKQLIEPITSGLSLMIANPERFKLFNASNGWGTYDQFIPWIREYLQACIDYPEADVEASR